MNIIPLTKIIKEFGFAPFFRYLFVGLVFILILMFAAIISCATPTPDAGVPSRNPATLKPNLEFQIDNVSYVGSTVAQRSTRSVIKIQPKPDTSLILISTCARQKDFWNIDTRKTFVYEYTPMFDVENRGACPMYLTLITKQGEWYRGIIDWTNSTHAKDATLQIGCDGDWFRSVGNFICSIAAEYPLYIKSEKKVVVGRDTSTNCPEAVYQPLPVNQYEILTRLPQKGDNGMCVYTIITQDKEYFRLTTYAYTSILKVFPPEK